MIRIVHRLFYVFVVLLFATAGCGNCDHFSAGERGAETDLCSDGDATNAGTVSDEEFDKPSSPHSEYPDIFTELSEKELEANDEALVSTFFVASPMMTPDSAYDHGYLYEGESAIFRFGTVALGDAVEEGNVRMQVLVNYEPVPFGMVPADTDGRFATDEQMQTLEERSLVHHFERGEGDIFGMSMIVDPEHFQTGRANEFRLLMIEDVEQPEEVAHPAGRPAVGLVGMLVHYDGSRPIDLSCIADPMRYTPPEAFQRHYQMMISALTELSHDSIDPEEQGWTADSQPDLRYVMEIDSSTAAIRSSIVNRVRSDPMTRYAILYNYITGEFTPLGLVENVPPLQAWYEGDFSEELAVKTYTDVEVEPSETNAFMTLYFDGWFHHDEAASGGFDSTFEASNLVWFEYNP